MNNYSFEDIKVGMEESFTISVTPEMMENFKQITGDVNPLHMDEAYAKEKGYLGKVAYGMLTASFLSTLAGVYLPGAKSLIHSVETKFVKPVYSGDILTVSGKVTELQEVFSVFTMKVEIHNQNGEKVLRGKMKIGVLE